MVFSEIYVEIPHLYVENKRCGEYGVSGGRQRLQKMKYTPTHTNRDFSWMFVKFES